MKSINLPPFWGRFYDMCIPRFRYCRDPDGNLLEFITYDGGAAARAARSRAIDINERDWAAVRARHFPGAARHTAYLNTAVHFLYKNDEFCIENEEILYHKNEKLCKNENFVFKMIIFAGWRAVSKNDEFCINIEEFCTTHEELCIKNEELCI